jgi:hypothetical protein
LRGGDVVKDIEKLTDEEMLYILCAPAATDEPEEPDFIAENGLDEKSWEIFAGDWIARELN